MRYLKVVSFLFACILFLTIASFTAKAEDSVTISYTQGTAEILRAGQTGWQNAETGMVLVSGDSVKTHQGSSVELSFDNEGNNLVNIEENAYVVIKLEGNEKIELIDGEILALVTHLPKGSLFEIRTPVAVCGARGTGWGSKTKKDETRVDCYEHKAYAKGIDKNGNVMKDNLTVPKGFRTVVKRFQRPSKLMKLAAKDFMKWNKWKERRLQQGSANNTRMERLSRDLTKIQGEKEKIEERKDENAIRRREKQEDAGTGTSSSEHYYKE